MLETFLILTVCASAQVNSQGCQKATTAYGQQIGVDKYLIAFSKPYVNDVPVELAGPGVVIYTLVSNKTCVKLNDNLCLTPEPLHEMLVLSYSF